MENRGEASPVVLHGDARSFPDVSDIQGVKSTTQGDMMPEQKGRIYVVKPQGDSTKVMLVRALSKGSALRFDAELTMDASIPTIMQRKKLPTVRNSEFTW